MSTSSVSHAISQAIGLVALAALAAACGDDATSETTGSGTGASAGTGGSDVGGAHAGGSGTGGSGAFDPEHPGIYMFLSLGAVTMMGQPTELAAGGFMKAAREDFEPEVPEQEIPLDTCVAGEEPAPTPSCASEEECAPEQDCLPETDSNGQPIAGSNHCQTPREPLDVGPVTMEGFTGGPIELRYNAGQNGAYTADGAGDGQLEPGTLAFDVTYTFQGAGSATHELGPFSGSLDMPAALTITAPAWVELPGLPGMMGFSVNPNQDLVLQWTGGAGDGIVRLNLVAAQGEGLPVNCRVTDDGDFTIPAAMLQAAQLGAMAFFNMMTIEREAAPGSASGDGLAHHEIGVIQTLIVNVATQ